MGTFGFSTDSEVKRIETAVPDDYGRVYNDGGSFRVADDYREVMGQSGMRTGLGGWYYRMDEVQS